MRFVHSHTLMHRADKICLGKISRQIPNGSCETFSLALSYFYYVNEKQSMNFIGAITSTLLPIEFL